MTVDTLNALVKQLEQVRSQIRAGRNTKVVARDSRPSDRPATDINYLLRLFKEVELLLRQGAGPLGSQFLNASEAVRPEHCEALARFLTSSGVIVSKFIALSFSLPKRRLMGTLGGSLTARNASVLSI